MIGILVLLALTLVGNSYADPRVWDTDGVAVRKGYDLRWQGQVARSETGSNLVVWTDGREERIALIGQLYSPQGDPQWGHNGMLLARSEGIGIYDPEIVRSEDGWFAFWFDYDIRIEGEDEIYVGRPKLMKYSDEGDPLWPDPERIGISMWPEEIDNFNDGYWGIVPDGAGGAYVQWSRRTAIYVQRVNSDGTIAWPTAFELDSGSWMPFFKMVDDGLGNAFICWTISTEIYLEKLDPNGILLWDEPVHVQTNSSFRSDLNVAADGTGGVIVAWNDRRHEPSFDIYMQRVSNTGQQLWQFNGVRVSESNSNVHSLRLAACVDGNSIDGVLVQWVQQIGFDQDALVAQKVNLNGGIVWSAGGEELCTNNSPQVTIDEPRLLSDRSGGLIACWSEYEDLSERLIKLTRLNAAGEQAWAGHCAVTVSDSGWISTGRAAIGGNDNILTLWRTSYSTNPPLMWNAHSFSSGQEIEPEPQVLCELFDGEAAESQMVSVANGGTAFFWRDTRYGRNEYYYQILNGAGTEQFVRDGVRLVVASDLEHPSLNGLVTCSDDLGGFFAVYKDYVGDLYEVHVAHVDVLGQHFTPPNGVAISPNPQYDQLDPTCIADRSGGAYVAYSTFDESFQLDAMLARVDTYGEPVWSDQLSIGANPEFDDFVVGLVPCDANSCIVIWRTGDFRQYTFHASKVTLDGTIVWEHEVIPQTDTYSVQVVPWDGASLVWQRDSVNSADIFTQYISTDGVLRYPSGGLAVTSEEGVQGSPRASVVDDGYLIVAWLDLNSQTGTDIRAQKVSSNGNLMWDESKLLFHGTSQYLALEEVLSTFNNGIYITWTDVPPAMPTHQVVYATHLDEDGELAPDAFWHQEGGAIVCESRMGQWNPKMCLSSDQSVVISWLDLRTSDYSSSLYAQRFGDWIPHGDANVNPELAFEFSLSQNYPNPFNPETVIEFALPTASKATLRVFDVTGRLVATLIDESLAAGVHRANFDAARLASGVYFYRLEAAKYSMTRKMVVLK